LWHGAAWTFVVWGGLHGLMLVAEHALFGERKDSPPAAPWLKAFGVFVTFHCVCLTWIFFRSPDFEHAIDFLVAFANIGTAPTHATPFLLTLLAIGFILHVLPKDRVDRVEQWCQRIPVSLQAAALGAAIVAIDALGPEGVAPFIYFQF
jgi:hypothetical protein